MKFFMGFILGVALVLGGGYAGFKKYGTIENTVYRIPVNADLEPQDVEDSMLSKAADLNMKIVGQNALSQELKNRGVATGFIKIYQFCNPEDARKILDFDVTMGAYMPCRIVLIEDKAGKLWLEMLDLNLMILMAEFPPELDEIAVRIDGTLKAIMEAGATGDF